MYRIATGIWRTTKVVNIYTVTQKKSIIQQRTRRPQDAWLHRSFKNWYSHLFMSHWLYKYIYLWLTAKGRNEDLVPLVTLELCSSTLCYFSFIPLLWCWQEEGGAKWKENSFINCILQPPSFFSWNRFFCLIKLAFFSENNKHKNIFGPEE